ncbi:hypothetical protein [Sulfitobacter alexandrii]|nr:hypothetical protein [Sulfitobacter alexandrii]
MTTAKEQSKDTLSETVEAQAAGETAELDPASLAAIRELLACEVAEPQPPATGRPEAAAQAEPAAVAPAPRMTSKRELLEQQAIAPQEPLAAPTPVWPRRGTRNRADAPASRGRVGRLKAAVTGYRPTPRHIVIGACALIVVLRPWLVLGLALLGLFVMTGVFLILGYDGFWRRAMGLARWYARRHPSRAVELHRKLDSFAMKWDAILDRFPEGTVDGLYLPDFGDLAEADSRHDAAMDRRLSEMRERGA